VVIDTDSASEPDIVIELSRYDDPDTPLHLKVITGDYSLVNGATLKTGSSVRVREEWMTFPQGLAIDVGADGITLQGENYAEGARLLVDESGNLVESDTSAEAVGEVSSAELPTYSEVVATYPDDVERCTADVTIVGGTADNWMLEMNTTMTWPIVYHCYGTKVELGIDATFDDGNDYPAGTLFTVDADMNRVQVSSWD
jgi:hypothetical protein